MHLLSKQHGFILSAPANFDLTKVPCILKNGSNQA